MSDLSDLELDVVIASAVSVYKKKCEGMKRRKIHVNDFLLERDTKGRHQKDFADMLRNPLHFRENFRTSPEIFYNLLGQVEGSLKPKLHARPDSLSPELKLALTLEFLASGDIFRHIASVYRVSSQRVGVVIEETCDAIIGILKSSSARLSKEAWVDTANEFNMRWNFPNCLGAIDGKHVAIKCPHKAGSLFYNYKGYHSIVLMAVADAEYRFLYYDVGAYGSEGDSSVFRECEFGKKLMRDSFDFPPNASILGCQLPFFFLGDDAFPLHKRIMKPYAPKNRNALTNEQRIFNYRLSRARRCVENAFGILCSRWICLARTMFMTPTRAQKIVTTCVLLHNFLMDTDRDFYTPPGYTDAILTSGEFVEGSWRANMPNDSCYHQNLQAQNNGRHSISSKLIRDTLCSYVNSSVGSVEWQNNIL